MAGRNQRRLLGRFRIAADRAVLVGIPANRRTGLRLGVDLHDGMGRRNDLRLNAILPGTAVGTLVSFSQTIFRTGCRLAHILIIVIDIRIALGIDSLANFDVAQRAVIVCTVAICNTGSIHCIEMLVLVAFLVDHLVNNPGHLYAAVLAGTNAGFLTSSLAGGSNIHIPGFHVMAQSIDGFLSLGLDAAPGTGSTISQTGFQTGSRLAGNHSQLVVIHNGIVVLINLRPGFLGTTFVLAIVEDVTGHLTGGLSLVRITVHAIDVRKLSDGFILGRITVAALPDDQTRAAAGRLRLGAFHREFVLQLSLNLLFTRVTAIGTDRDRQTSRRTGCRIGGFRIRNVIVLKLVDGLLFHQDLITDATMLTLFLTSRHTGSRHLLIDNLIVAGCLDGIGVVRFRTASSRTGVGHSAVHRTSLGLVGHSAILVLHRLNLVVKGDGEGMVTRSGL